jgi:hypothetical protein
MNRLIHSRFFEKKTSWRKNGRAFTPPMETQASRPIMEVAARDHP